MARPRDHQKHISLATQDLAHAFARVIEAISLALRSQSVAASNMPLRKGPKAKPSAGRLRQIAAMKAYWAKKRAEKSKERE